MASVNLLPEELRRVEKKERQQIARRPKVFEIELNDSKKLGKVGGSDKPQESWWRKILGYSDSNGSLSPEMAKVNVQQKHQPVLSALPKAPATKPTQFRAEFKQTSTIKHDEPKEFKPKKERHSWWSFLGSPQSLITSLNGVKRPAKLKPANHFQASADVAINRPAKEAKINYVLESGLSGSHKSPAKILSQREVAKPVVKLKIKKSPTDSWWEIFKSLFSPVHHQSNKYKLVHDWEVKQTVPSSDMHKNHLPLAEKPHLELPKPSVEKPVIKSIEKPVVKPVEKKIDHPKKSKHKFLSAYHLAEKVIRPSWVGVNLMPSDDSAGPKANRGGLGGVLLAIVIPIIFISALYGLLAYQQLQVAEKIKIKHQELADLEKQIGDYRVREQLNNETADKILTIKNRLDGKFYWSNFFDLLEKYTLDGVYYTNLSADTSGQLVLPGVASDYETLSKQLAVFNNATDFVKEVKIGNTQLYSEGKAGVIGVSFQLRLLLAEHVFDTKKN